jgi:hypothetical protein
MVTATAPRLQRLTAPIRPILDLRDAAQDALDRRLDQVRGAFGAATARWPALPILVQVVLGIAFLAICANLLVSMAIDPSQLGSDARVYFRAAGAAVSGENPWTVEAGGVRFAGPPPTLLPYIVLQPLGENAAWAISLVAAAASALLLIVRLHLGPAFLLFPPLVYAVIAGNPEPLMVLALLTAGFRWLGPVLKVYAFVPLLVLARWRAVAAALAVCLLSLPLWPQFLASLSDLSTTYAAQNGRGFSVVGDPVVAVLVIVGLLILGRRRGAWLVVPLLWPGAQAHYAVMALPAIAELIRGAGPKRQGVLAQ